MARSSRKFSVQADQLSEHLTKVVISAVRTGLEEGFKAAVENTVQDSSNAAAHWMIGVEGQGNIYGRKFGKLRDLRGTGDSLVGNQGDNRDSTAQAKVVVDAVVGREKSTVIDKYVRGQTKHLDFYFYNAAAGDTKYDKHAGVSDAGKYAAQVALENFQRDINLGRVRRGTKR